MYFRGHIALMDLGLIFCCFQSRFWPKIATEGFALDSLRRGR